MNELSTGAYRWAAGIYAAFVAYCIYVFNSLGLFLGQHIMPQTVHGFSVLNPNFSLYNSTFTGLLTVLVIIFLFANKRLKDYVLDVGDELTRISWPAFKETQRATGMVIVFVILSSIFLFIADLAFLKLVNSIIGTAA